MIFDTLSVGLPTDGIPPEQSPQLESSTEYTAAATADRDLFRSTDPPPHIHLEEPINRCHPSEQTRIITEHRCCQECIAGIPPIPRCLISKRAFFRRDTAVLAIAYYGKNRLCYLPPKRIPVFIRRSASW